MSCYDSAACQTCGKRLPKYLISVTGIGGGKYTFLCHECHLIAYPITHTNDPEVASRTGLIYDPNVVDFF